MTPLKKIKVQDTEISVMLQANENDYISLTDMLKAKDGDFFISDWLRNRNTLEYLSAWETMNNPNFNYGEFATIKDKSGLNNFKISVKEWVEKTNAIGITAKAGRYGGTYAHKDIAFNFGMWISPAFQLYIVKEYQRLKEAENDPLIHQWDVKRLLSKTNYQLHTDAIKETIIPRLSISKAKERIIYATEADMLNLALFGCVAKDWEETNPELAKKYNMRDMASINQLIVLSNMESFNAEMIKNNIDRETRFNLLHRMAKEQMQALNKYNVENRFKKLSSDQRDDLSSSPSKQS